MAIQRSGDDDRRPTRRSLLCAVGVAGTSVASSTTGYRSERSADGDGDGIPDEKKRSAAFHRRLETVFGPSQFDGVEMGRQDLLIDVRYLGSTTVSPETKQTIVELFRSHDVRAQWLDYPQRYDIDRVDEQYGLGVEDLLWGRGSFYGSAIESDLKDVALQLVVVPGATDPPHEGRIYSRWMDETGGGIDGHVNGFNLGNRAVVAERDHQFVEARLVFHELTHLALCHDDDPENTGVMGTGEKLELMDEEWDRLRDKLSNVRDATGADFLFRSCLWEEQLLSIFDS